MDRNIIALLCLSGIFVALLVNCVHGCRRGGTSDNIPPKGQGSFNEPISDVWVGRLPLVSYMCGWPNETTSVHVRITRRQIVDPFKFLRENLEPSHTLVYFRGVVFEWGAGLLRSYANGTLGRDPHGCPILWRLQGQSNCSSAEIHQVAASYLSRYGPYDLLQNNCHSFSRRLARKLLQGDCTPF